jgi:DNA-binding NarL/FixJ family response regulator
VPNLPEERAQRDDKIAALLHAGKTIAEIEQTLHTSYRAVVRVRDGRGIPVPAGRIHRSRAELDHLEQEAVTMLRAGATQRDIYAKLRISPATQAHLRKVHRIPAQPPKNRRRRLQARAG